MRSSGRGWGWGSASGESPVYPDIISSGGASVKSRVREVPGGSRAGRGRGGGRGGRGGGGGGRAGGGDGCGRVWGERGGGGGGEAHRGNLLSTQILYHLAGHLSNHVFVRFRGARAPRGVSAP